MRLAAVIAIAVLNAPFWPPVVAAQEVHGRAVDGSGRPIGEAFVSLLDAGDPSATLTPIASTLTGADGSFLLVAPEAGTYRVELSRIGFETHLTDPFRLDRGETVSRTLTVATAPVVLGDLRVEIDSPCASVRVAGGADLLSAWAEVEKALDLTRWTEQTELRFALRVTDRRLGAAGRLVRDIERDETVWKTGQSSFLSASPQELADRGYVQRDGDTFHWYAPDAATLLSDSFRDEHCFRWVRGQDENRGLVGLAFEALDLSVPEVEGTLWLDPDTGELRHMEFEYVALTSGN